jgi:hypothetical protein
MVDKLPKNINNSGNPQMSLNPQSGLQDNLSSPYTIKVEPANEIHLEHEKFEDWDFFWNVERMLSSKEMDIIADKVRINRLPDMLFGNNRFYIVNAKHNFVYEINPLQMLDMGSYALRDQKLMSKEKIEKGEFIPGETDPNFIYYIPTDVKVQYYDKWKNMKIEREDVKKLDPTEDWTFSSSYMGTMGELDKHGLLVNNTTNNELLNAFDPFVKHKNVDIKGTDENLPINRLGQENPIIKYMEINLYDDELCDNGLSMGNFR